VYHQTITAARDARIDLASGAHWYDVDTPADLDALRQRLEVTHDADLITLRAQLSEICKDDESMNTTSQSPADSLGNEQMDLSSSTIMIVDDNAQNVELMQAYLEEIGCKTVVAYDGLEAMNWIENPEQALPDLILLDVMMPRMSGFEVCSKIKEDPNTRAIPVMMVTALNELGDIERGVESGTDDFVTKPVNKLELLTRVKSLLRVRHLKRELDRTMAYIQDIEKRTGETSDE
jgi:two-component system cell cycle response regulator